MSLNESCVSNVNLVRHCQVKSIFRFLLQATSIGNEAAASAKENTCMGSTTNVLAKQLDGIVLQNELNQNPCQPPPLIYFHDKC